MTIKTAMLLAAGRGERLRPLTDTCPKPLLPVQGKPMIVHWLEKLAIIGIEKVVVNVHYLGQQIMDALGDGSAYGLQIVYSIEQQLLGTAGGVQNALPLLGEQPFVLISSDIYTDYQLVNLTRYSLSEHRAWLHAVLVPNPVYHPQGDYVLSEGRLLVEGVPRYTFSALAVVHPCIFSGYSLIGQGMDAAFRRAITANHATGELFTGKYYNVSSVAEYEELK